VSLEHAPQRAASQRGAYLTAGQVRGRYGITDMTLWRWLRDPELGFPQPVTIRRRRYWSEAKLDAFDSEREQAA
jgi:hypothetical protein